MLSPGMRWKVEKVLPELVSTDKQGYKSVAYLSVVPVLVEAVKTLTKKMDALKKVLPGRDELSSHLAGQIGSASVRHGLDVV